MFAGIHRSIAYRNMMAKTDSTVRFKAKLFQPPAAAKARSLVRVALPKSASAKLAPRGATMVEGTINGAPFPRVPLEPDGHGSHWLRVNWPMRQAAGADVGDVVTMEIAPAEPEREPKVPADFRKALAGAPKARAMWSDITLLARRDWILWIEGAKQADTRKRRVSGACSRLAAGKRRICCFDSYKTRMDKLNNSKPRSGEGKKNPR